MQQIGNNMPEVKHEKIHIYHTGSFISDTWKVITTATVTTVVITTAQLHSTKPKLRFCAGSISACRV